MNYKKLVIKVGTNVITKNDGTLDVVKMRNIVGQVIKLKSKGIEVIMVSSGAMGAGRKVVKNLQVKDDVAQRQILAAVGQTELMSIYNKLFGKKSLCAQVLATKEDFKDEQHYTNMYNCFQALLRQGVVPIVNENDVVAVDELMFTDNDEMAGLIATMIGADALLMLTVVDGVYDQTGKQVLSVIDGQTKWQACLTKNKSIFGRGGMQTKCELAHKLAAMGLTVYIINGKKENIIMDVLANKQVGTKFLPIRKQKVSGIRKRIGFLNGQEKGSVYVDKWAEKLLLSDKVVSLLPVGVAKINGQFKKGDLVKIKNFKGRQIGLGMVQYDSTKAKQYLGKKNKRELIHYNYLLVDI